MEEKELYENLIKKMNKLPKIGFALMLLGPMIILFARISFFGANSDDIVGITEVLKWLAIVAPGIGAILCIVATFCWKELSGRSQILATIVFVMCNPIFYSVYFMYCYYVGFVFAGFSLM